MADSLYKKGDKVRGVPGRISENWVGTVVSICADGGVMVDWDGRRKHEDHRVRKEPVLYMLAEQIELMKSVDHQGGENG